MIRNIMFCVLLLGAVAMYGADSRAACWRQTGTIKFNDFKPVAVATAINRICIAGSSAGQGKIMICDEHGKVSREIAIGCMPTTVEVCDNGDVYYAAGNTIGRIQVGSLTLDRWLVLPDKVLIISLAVSKSHLIVADAANKCVYLFDLNGKLLQTVKGNEGFILPSPYFDVASDDDSFWVANPGRHQIENYSVNGRFIGVWKPDKRQGFLGCCNPAHFRLLPDGRILTSEKGKIRVRIFAPDGRLEAVVCDSDNFFPGSKFGHSISVTVSGEILVIDPRDELIRVYSLSGKQGN